MSWIDVRVGKQTSLGLRKVGRVVRISEWIYNYIPAKPKESKFAFPEFMIGINKRGGWLKVIGELRS